MIIIKFNKIIKNNLLEHNIVFRIQIKILCKINKIKFKIIIYYIQINHI